MRLRKKLGSTQGKTPGVTIGDRNRDQKYRMALAWRAWQEVKSLPGQKETACARAHLTDNAVRERVI